MMRQAVYRLQLLLKSKYKKKKDNLPTSFMLILLAHQVKIDCKTYCMTEFPTSQWKRYNSILFITQYCILIFSKFIMQNLKENKLDLNRQPPKQQAKQPQKQINPLSIPIVQQCIKINGEKSNKVYQKISLLGKGGFAQCYLTRQKDNLKKMATKIIPKKLLESHRTKIRLANEIKLHKSLHNEYVVQFYTNFEDEENVYINLQVCENGSINDLLRSRYFFTTPEVQSFVYGICQGLKYLHSRNIIHRDLKLGNVFLNGDFKVKIGDFGLACKLQFARQFKRTVCGTPNYIAPEILEGKGYHFQVDVWAVGVIIYTLFFTVPPFQTQEPHTTYQKIKKCEYQIPKHHQAPPQAIDLIKKLLVTNPSERLTLDEILESPFMKIGNKILLGLPSVTLKRPPNKKQISSWPSITGKLKEQTQSEMNSTLLGFFGKSKKDQLKRLNESKRQSESKFKDNQKENQKTDDEIFCRTVEQLSNQLYFFSLSNGNFGVYDTNQPSVYTCHLKDIPDKLQRGLESVKKRNLNDSGSYKQLQIQSNECPHKILLSIKHKQLINEKMNDYILKQLDKSVTASKVNLYKDIFLVRLSNRGIQIIFKQKDGFLISPNRKNIEYFYSFKDVAKGKQICLGSLLEIEVVQKQNKGSNSSHMTMNRIFCSGKHEKHQLTMKKIQCLKTILKETVHKSSKKTNDTALNE